MSATFYEEFNRALPDMEAQFGETWLFNNTTWPAIAIDDLRMSRLAGEAGGPLAQASVTVHIRKSVRADSGVAQGKKITARGEMVRVMTIADAGDDAVTLICGPLGAPIV